MKKIGVGFIFLVVLLSTSMISFGEEFDKILVVHSYHHGLEWTDRISEGIHDVLSETENVEIHYEYLDTKRFYGEDYHKKLTELFLEKTKLIDYKAVIVSDNAAFEFLLEYRSELYDELPIIFCGINDFHVDQLQDEINISGIAEVPDHKANIELMLELHPDSKKILIINDKTKTGQAIKSELLPIIELYKDRVTFELYEDFLIEDIGNDLAIINRKMPIYLLVLNRDSSGRFISYRDGIGVVKKHVSNPIYGAWEFYLGKGIIGGKLTSGYEHGKAAAKMVQELLLDKPAKLENINYSLGNQYYFDYEYLKAHGIKKSDVPRGSIIVNEPPSSWTIYKDYYIMLIVALFVSVMFLVIDAFKKKWEALKLKNSLAEQSKELEVSKVELYRLAVTDFLTASFNRSYIQKKLEEYVVASSMLNKRVSIIMFDVDGFKVINERYGHATGDEVLRKIVDRSVTLLKEEYLIGRYGGDEFLIVLPDSNIATAVKLAERIRTAVVEIRYGIETLSTSISCGIVEVDKMTYEEAISQVDIKLAEAKNNGKNRVAF